LTGHVLTIRGLPLNRAYAPFLYLEKGIGRAPSQKASSATEKTGLSGWNGSNRRMSGNCELNQEGLQEMKRDTRPITVVQAAVKGAKEYFPPISAPSSARVEEVYAAVLSAVPSSQRAMTSTRLMAIEMAEAVVQCERLSKVLDEQGDFYVDSVTGTPKLHPACNVRHAASMRIATYMTKLRLVPSADIRELQRAGNYEANLRGNTVLTSPVEQAGEEPDWSAMLAEMKKGERNANA
jgi:hypothetical protein